MLKVKVGEKDSLERALKKLKKKFDSCKIVKQLRDRKQHTKKSVKRREQIKKAKWVEQKFKTID
jgi:small subunit ribosomal protein S21